VHRSTVARVKGRCGPEAAFPFVPSAALLVRADVATGPAVFDPAASCGEDVDLVWRLDERAGTCATYPASTVAHEGPTTLRTFLGRRAFYGRRLRR